MTKRIGAGLAILVAVVIIAGAALVLVGPKVYRWARRQIAAEQDRRKLAADWQPPAPDALPDKLFPAEVGGYQRDSHDEEAAIPDFQFNAQGRHGVYRSGSSQVEVYAYQASEEEKDALFQLVDDAYEKGGGGTRQITKMGYRCYYSSPQHHQNHLWWMKGWLFVFRTRDAEDREEFVKAYLNATSAQGQEE